MKKRTALLCLMGAVASCMAYVSPAFARGGQSEKILSYHSHITVHKDSSMTVSETIKVYASGRKIKRGIYRDFPTRYRDHFGNRYVVGFKVTEVLKDGEPEPYHIKRLSNGKRIYIGHKKVFLRPGQYEYRITYKTTRQLGFFKDHDELYWNVTGNGWEFNIDEASATVVLPPGARGKLLSADGYTGPQGAKGRNFTQGTDSAGNTTFVTTRALGPKEGLTIVVSWPKGVVEEPTFRMKLGYMIRDNLALIIGLIGLAVLVLYYMIAWAMVGKDPAAGTIIPMYSPPERLSPAAVRYIKNMGYDHKTFAASVIDMAVKGFLSIEENDDVYTIRKTGDDTSALSAEEKKIAGKLLKSNKPLKLKQSNHRKIQSAIKAVRKALRMNFEKTYFVTNRRYFLPALIGSLGLGVLCGLFSGSTGEGIFITLWLSLWSVGVAALLSQAVKLWRSVFRGMWKSLGGALFFTLFSIPFLGGEVFGIYMFIANVSISLGIVFVAIILINYIFYRLLKAPTLAGRRVLDKIEGFRMYLSVAEKDRLNVLTPPAKTPELFERYLPYALALDVEQQWSEQFSDVLASAGEGKQYHPSWYVGSSFTAVGAGAFASSLGSSFSGAISAASTAPGSSSGGGGGFSGGGGGGGGGGGW